MNPGQPTHPAPGWDDAGVPPIVDPSELGGVTFSFIPDEPRRPVRNDHSAYGMVVQLEGVRVGEINPRTQGSGVLIGPDLLLTAAHVLFDDANDVFGSSRGGYAGQLYVKSPALRIPVMARMTTQFIAAGGYRNDRNPSYDLAVVKLGAPIRDAAGLSPYAATSQELEHTVVEVFGYPEGANERLYLARGRCIGGLDGLIFHTADATSGVSGGAIVAPLQGGARLIGLHRAGPGESPPAFADSCGGIRFTPDAIDWIEGRKAKL